ncbi:MAG: ATP-binding protein [Lachnospiraceae bacterium]|nr:ATP-binding protein [Lachnospiraceae bacterium]
MTLADRDISILKMIENNYFKYACCFLILVAGIAFLILSIIQRIYRKSSDGMEYLCVFCFVSFIYYCIETKSMNLFYGNQTLYSVIVFFSLMLLPLFFIPYYTKGIVIKKSKTLNILFLIAILNAVIQTVLQLTNLVDFMDMAVFSHIILFVSIWFTLMNVFISNIRKEENSYWLDFIALLPLGLCGIFDIVHSYFSTSEHIEKYSRYGTTIFCLFMLISHMVKIVRSQMQALKEKEEKANAANEAKSIFLARMSHEIRTPINAVLGMNEMILRESNEENVLEYSANIDSSAHALLSIINEILDLSKIEAGKMVLTPVEYNLSSLLHDIYIMTEVRAKDKDLVFKINVDPLIPAKYIGDDVKVRQILTNLLSNAVKYTHKGYVYLKVSGYCKDDAYFLCFEVQDSGIGIKDEDMPKLFEEFQRIEEKKNRSIEGTGLGMSITVQLLKLMDSTLNVESEYGKGSRFFFQIKQEVVDATFQRSVKRKIIKKIRCW